MLANFLNKSKPINFIGITILFFLGYLFFVFKEISKQTITIEILLSYCIIFGFFLILFFIFNFIVVKNSLTLDNLFAFFFFTLFTFAILPKITNNSILIILLVHLLALRKIYSLRSPQSVLEKLFDAGFWLGVLFILQPQTLIFIPLIYSAIYLYHRINIHSLLIPFIGWITPLILYFTYTLWLGQIESFSHLFELNFNSSFAFYSTTKFIFLVIYLACITVLSFVIKTKKTIGINNSFRKKWILITAHLMQSLLYIILISDKNGAELMFSAFPVTVILANGVEMIASKKAKNMALLFILVSALCFYFTP